jgi:hypothetical protein
MPIAGAQRHVERLKGSLGTSVSGGPFLFSHKV